MPSSLETLFAPLPSLGDLHPVEARAVLALRAAACARSDSIPDTEAIARRLDRPAAVPAFRLLLAALSAAWPEPLAVARPCCPRLSPDEATFVAMLRRAAGGQRAAFETLLCEMVEADMRERLWSYLIAFLHAWAVPG